MGWGQERGQTKKYPPSIDFGKGKRDRESPKQLRYPNYIQHPLVASVTVPNSSSVLDVCNLTSSPFYQL